MDQMIAEFSPRLLNTFFEIGLYIGCCDDLVKVQRLEFLATKERTGRRLEIYVKSQTYNTKESNRG